MAAQRSRCVTRPAHTVSRGEKAGRGVDGRLFPWGDTIDPSWCSVHHSARGRPIPASRDAFPSDESVYGVRGMAGNIRDWCQDARIAGGPRIVDEQVYPPENSDNETNRIIRGGSCRGDGRSSRSAQRMDAHPASRRRTVGFRLCRSMD